MGQLVTEIGYTAGSNQTKIDVTWQDEKTGVTAPTKTYDAVFNSATLGSMKYMKLENLNLNWDPGRLFETLDTVLHARSVFASTPCGGWKTA